MTSNIMSTLSSPQHAESPIRKVAILFAGGPAPAANAVISTAAASFLRNDIQVMLGSYCTANARTWSNIALIALWSKGKTL